MKQFFSSKLFILLLFVVVVGVVLVLSTRPRQVARQAPPTRERPTSLPSIDRSAGIPGAPSDVALSGSLPQTEAPQSFPVYRVRFDEPEVLARRLAATFEFTGEPIVYSQGPPVVWRWTQGGRDLTIQLKTPPAFSFRQPPVVSTPKNANTQQEAHDFVTRVAVLPQGVTLSMINTQAVPPPFPGSNTPSPNAGIIVDLRYHIGRYSLLLLPNTLPDVTVFFDDERRVYRATATLPPVSIVPAGDRPLVEPGVALRLLSQDGVLISVGEEPGSSPEDSTSPQFSDVAITNVEIVYYFLEKEQLIVPAYLFTGTASGGGGQRPFPVSYLIRATQ